MKRVLQQGFSLIELMIAIVLGCILLLGVMQVLISTSTLGTTSSNLSVNQDTARSVLSLLGGESQRAGYKGCGPGGMITSEESTDWKNTAPILPVFADGFGIRFAYGMDRSLAGTSGKKLKDGTTQIQDCLGKDLYYRGYSYVNCVVGGKSGICINGYSTPSTKLVDNEFIEGANIDEMVFTVPKDDGKFKEISVKSTSSNEFQNLSDTKVQDVLDAKLVTFFITITTTEPRPTGATGQSMTTIKRTYSASYPLKNNEGH